MKPTYNTQGTLLEYPKDKSLIDLFLAQVTKTPDNLAVEFENKKITYNELDKLTHQFANYLMNVHDIQAHDFVGLMLNRSEWLIIGILSVLKTGAAYIPIDPDYPQKRKEYIQNDSRCKIIIDDKLIEEFIANKETHYNNTTANITIKPNDLSYIIYTSGTTGNPKGVMIKHKSVINLIASQTLCFNIDEEERILQFSNYCFDASVEQIFLALLNGAALYIISKDDLKNHQLPEFIAKNKITHLHATPSYLETLPNLSELKSLKRIIAGGESCSLKLAQKLSKNCDFYNEYGPTETTVTSTIYKYNSE